MEIRKVDADNEEFLKILHTLSLEWDGYGVYWSHFLEFNSFENITIWGVYRNNRLDSFCFIKSTRFDHRFSFLEKPMEISSIVHSQSESDLSELLWFLKYHYSMIMVEWEVGYEAFRESEYEKLDLDFEKGTFDSLDTGLYISYLPMSIKQQWEKKLQKGEVIELHTEVKNSDEMLKELKENEFTSIPLYRTIYNQVRYYGFKYFNPTDLNRFYDQNYTFICAYSKERTLNSTRKRLVGVILIGEYGKGEDFHKGLCFTDVHWDYRRIGIATKMYQTLNEWLDEGDVLVSSSLSKEGRVAQLDKVRNKYVTKCMVFNDSYEHSNYLRKRKEQSKVS